MYGQPMISSTDAQVRAPKKYFTSPDESIVSHGKRSLKHITTSYTLYVCKEKENYYS